MTAIVTFGLASITSAQVPSYVPTSGLVGWWPFNGNAKDESGNGNNGTVVNAIPTTDRNGNAVSAYYFDGAGDYISVPTNSALNLPNSFAISFFFEVTTYINNAPGFISKGGYDFPQGWFIQFESSGLTLRTSVGNYNPRSSFAVGIWHHAVVQYNRPSHLREIYVDGINVFSSSGALTIPSNNAPMLFGTQDELEWYLNGKLDDIGIWNRALTQQEITDLYNANNVGINETSQDKLFSVFPNPAQSVINVKADSKLIGQVYSIYDNTGRAVLTGKLNSENTTIELGNLSGGIYMFGVGEDMKQTFKVIKE